DQRLGGDERGHSTHHWTWIALCPSAWRHFKVAASLSKSSSVVTENRPDGFSGRYAGFGGAGSSDTTHSTSLFSAAATSSARERPGIEIASCSRLAMALASSPVASPNSVAGSSFSTNRHLKLRSARVSRAASLRIWPAVSSATGSVI